MAKPVTPLNDEKCKTLRFAENGSNRLFDGEGLYLEVLPSGGKRWRLRYVKADAKESLLTLGNYPEVGLRAARQMRSLVKESIPAGIDVSQALANYRSGIAPAPTVKKNPHKTTAPKKSTPPIVASAVAATTPFETAPSLLVEVNETELMVFDSEIHINLGTDFGLLQESELSVLENPAEFLGFGIVEHPILVPELLSPDVNLLELPSEISLEVLELTDELTLIDPYLSEQQILQIEEDIKSRLQLDPSNSVTKKSGIWSLVRTTPVLSVCAFAVVLIAVSWYFAKNLATQQVEQKISQLELIEKNKDLLIQQLKQDNQQSVQKLNELATKVQEMSEIKAQKEKLEQERRVNP